LRAIAIDDWSWRIGFTYRTIIVELECRTVADVLTVRHFGLQTSWRTRKEK
jgi:hypothetical protein